MPYVFADAHRSEFLGWEVRANCAISKQEQLGDACMRIRSSASGDADMQQAGTRVYWVPCTGSAQYTVRCEVLAGSVGRTVELWVSQWNIGPSGAFITEGSVASVSDSTSGWTLLSGSVTVNASCRRLRIRIIVKSTGAANEDHYVKWVAVNTGTTDTMPAQFFKFVDHRGFRTGVTSTGDATVDMPAIGGATIGNYLVAFVAVDNSGTNGAAPGLAVSDPRNGSWTVGTPANNDPGAASAGITAYLCYVLITAAMVNGDDVTFDYTTGSPRSAIVIWEVEGLHPTSPVAVAQTTATSVTTTVTISRTPTAAGQVVVAMTAVEGLFSAFGAHDTDTTDGNWEATTTNAEANTGTDTTSVSLNTGYKIVTGTTAQSWDNTLTVARDTASVAIVFALGPWKETFTGAVTPSGVVAKQVNRTLVGSVTPAGALVKLISRALAGAVTPAGTVAKQVNRTLSGAVTPTGELSFAQSAQFAGAVTPSGELVKQVNRSLTGAVAPTGAVAKLVNRSLAGEVTPSGTLNAVQVLARLFAGEVTPSGAVAKQVNRTLAGAATSSGTVARNLNRGLAGAVTPSGAAAKLVGRSVDGSVSPDGTLTGQVGRALAGAVTPSGAIARNVDRALGGAVASSGAASKVTARSLSGAVAPSGTLQTLQVLARLFGGAVTPTGALAKRVDRTLVGDVTASGLLAKQVARALAGEVTPVGTLGTAIGVAFGGTVTPVGGVGNRQLTRQLVGVVVTSGAVAKATERLLGGSVTPSGTLVAVIQGGGPPSTAVAVRAALSQHPSVVVVTVADGTVQGGLSGGPRVTSGLGPAVE